MPRVALTAEERDVLRALSKEHLIFLAKIADDKDFQLLIDIVNHFKDVEKDVFFKNPSYDKEKLSADLSFSRGSIAGQVKLIHIIGGAKIELQKREEERKK